jgi:hypothetical protein
MIPAAAPDATGRARPAVAPVPARLVYARACARPAAQDQRGEARQRLVYARAHVRCGYHVTRVTRIELTDADCAPLAELQFQHWGERAGMPYAALRPLVPDAALRVWQHTAAMSASAWGSGAPDDDDDDDDVDVDVDAGRLDLRDAGEWSEASVREWLLARVGDRGQPVVACFQPRVAVRLAWGVLCDHWLVLLWTGGCVWPESGEWVLVHDGDQFLFARR